MINVVKEGVLLEKTKHGFENEGVFNPAVIRKNGHIHVFYRAVRKGNFSSIGYALLDHPINVVSRQQKPLLIPEHRYEKQGMEDPRITKIDDTYYLTYSAYDGKNVLGALATSKDLKTFKKKGIISPKFTYEDFKHLAECCEDLIDKYYFHYKIFKEHGLNSEMMKKLYVWDKNLMFFPRKINGKYAMIHRIHPGIQLVLFENFSELTKEFWEDYLINLSSHIIMDPELQHESSHIGGGAPPMETEDGWLFIYHAVEDTPHGLVYCASAALLDKDDPKKVIARLKKPLISPQFRWEKEGYVRNIIFPTGTVIDGDDLYIYYGATDTKVAVAKVSFQSLITSLKSQTDEAVNI